MSDEYKIYSSRIDNVILDFWASCGFDAGRSLFAERLSFRGIPIPDVPHRAMVQARQIYVFCDAARNGGLPHVGELALEALDNLLRRFCDETGPSQGFAFSITTDGAIVSARRDAYAHAFILLALASAHRMTGAPRYLKLASQTNDFIERRLVDPLHLGLYASWPAENDDKLQNPLMHLLEAYLALHETCPTGQYLEKAEGVVRLFTDRLYRRAETVLPEYFQRDWSQHRDPSIGCFIEPGHHFEWVWLLSKFDRMAQMDHSSVIEGLWNAACRAGIRPDGLCYDAVGFDFSPLRKSTRLWPHTEGAKAAAARINIDPTAMPLLETMVAALNSVFLGRPFAAGWIDQFDSNHVPLVNYVPASSLYHLYLANIELEKSLSTRSREQMRS